MATRRSRVCSTLLSGLMIFWAAGCSPPQPKLVEEAEQPAALAVNSENQQVAEAVLGKQAEIVAEGDLARNGSKQLLVVNRVRSAARVDPAGANPDAMLVTRAVIVEKDDDRWGEVLRCDEHLKNPRGYLGGAPGSRVTGWRLTVNRNTDHGLELQFVPAVTGEGASTSNSEAGNSEAGGEAGSRAISVRWNTKAKRYQSLDQSHKGFLGEVPTLETPQSILK